MERVLGGGILWMKVPSVKSVMKAVRARIVSNVLAGLPELPPETLDAGIPLPGTSGEIPLDGGAPAENLLEAPAAPPLPPEALPDGEAGVPPEAADDASPFLAKVCRQLIERLGPEKAVEALITVHYGELLDPSRYGTVAEFTESPPPLRPQRGGRASWEAAEGGRGRRGAGGRRENRGPGTYREGFAVRREGRNFAEDNLSEAARVYVGLGRQHGASARDVAALLMRAGGVPGRMVDDIEMKDYCAFATMPEDAARRACVFSRNTPSGPSIRFAKPIR
jgi:ATP-dependent RNA helicase DeaD